MSTKSHFALRESAPRRSKALYSLAKLIVESFVTTIPADIAAALAQKAQDESRRKEFAESWTPHRGCLFPRVVQPKKSGERGPVASRTRFHRLGSAGRGGHSMG